MHSLWCQNNPKTICFQTSNSFSWKKKIDPRNFSQKQILWITQNLSENLDLTTFPYTYFWFHSPIFEFSGKINIFHYIILWVTSKYYFSFPWTTGAIILNENKENQHTCSSYCSPVQWQHFIYTISNSV